MSQQPCKVCTARADLTGDMVTFLPRESDLDWRERRLYSGYIGLPPDTAWLCKRHASGARAMSAMVTIDTALARLKAVGVHAPIAAGAEGIEGVEGAPLRVTIRMWERLLRRALPDIGVEIGISELDLEYHAQESCEPMEGLPDDVDPWPFGQQWSFHDGAGVVCLYSETVHHPAGQLARKVVVLMVSPRDAPRYEVRVTNAPNSVELDPLSVRIEGDPGGTVSELLQNYVTGITSGARLEE